MIAVQQLLLGLKPGLLTQTPALSKLPLRGTSGVVIQALPPHPRPGERPHTEEQLCLSSSPHVLTLPTTCRGQHSVSRVPPRPWPLPPFLLLLLSHFSRVQLCATP